MINSQNCPHCIGARKSHIGKRYKICGYCMQAVKERTVRTTERKDTLPIGMESASFLTTSGVTALAVFGLKISLFNGLILGLISALLVTGLIKPFILTLKAIGLVIIFLFMVGELVDFSLYFIEQVILFFELKNSLILKDGVVSLLDLHYHFSLV
ncbi:hypothetical protein NE848_13665 [Gramella jeungdoensis]|uniref:Uncharacterized protein n=1 Tax=Gramella jeungdoensis TaxID=708091 RepID=A0ABT0Z3Y0_9FLAO|nr:hypothetical protein [Gramella jeungdoensis]MCM8570436.1 hypothetical protein [Gramella jeungdoensis]